jgi:hypothetical protein
MEQAHRSAMAHHDHWSAQMGTWVMINAAWYKACTGPNLELMPIIV